MSGRKSRSRGARRKREADLNKEDLLRYVRKSAEGGTNLQRILEDFDATPGARKQIKDILNQLVKEGKVAKHRGSRYEAAARNLIEGRILVHRDGYGFVIPKEKIQGIDTDIYIPAPLIGSAMNGDKVKVEITLRKSGGRAEGRVASVEKRARDTIVGQLRYDGQVFFVSPADDKLPEKILITNDVAEHKDKIVEVEITRFPSETRWPAGKLVSVIGFIDDPNVETNVIIKKFALPAGFSKDIEEEAAALPEALSEKDFIGRDDFRKRQTITIDPKTARDFDDAIDVEALPDGTFQLGVHIADVSHFVALDSAMDREARFRGTSVYFPDRVIPMLPEKVSNHLCSLNPRMDRLAFSVMMHLSRSGEVLDYSFHKSVIHSRERMTYGDTQEILNGNAALEARYAHVAPQIHTIAKLAETIQKRRWQRGAIDFDLPEPMLTYNEQGDVTGITKSVRLFSHRIVEEFMILANEVVARHLEENDIPSLYRVHEEPDPMKVQEFVEIVSGFGLNFEPRKAQPADFQKFISSIEGRPEERMLSYLMLRSFKQARYSEENIGHFGLASDSYTHFTSPIRRYPDLVVHRILKAALARRTQPTVPHAQLDAIANESSERERLADQAERELFEWKKMLLMEQHLGDTFEAIIIGVWRDGFSIELIDYFVEGFVPVADIPNDFYQLDPSLHALVGRHTRQRFRLGDRIKVQVARVDKLLRRAYFVPVSPATTASGRVLARKRGSR
ncbi:MAG: ribonuclease R [Acidobacteria bacterium]|nr:MAG: ribonuclease R [Acidobacteriota bacterium]